MGIGVKRVGGDGVWDSEDGWERGVVDFYQLCGEAAGFEGFADDGGDELAVELDKVGGEQRLVVAGGAGVVEAGDFGGS